MLDKLNTELQTYNQKWQALVAGRKDKAFFEGLKPVAIGWKTKDRAEYDRICAELHDQAVTIIDVWMNGRWIAKVYLREPLGSSGIRIVKVMERRSGSTDAVGLDHLDFYNPKVAEGEAVLRQETDLQWTHEQNDAIAGYDWLSVWFDGTEAKLKTYTILDTIRDELEALNQKVIA